jgi:hypothetical protein
MANTNTIYRGKKAASNANPITNAVPFASSDDSTKPVIVYFPIIAGTTSAAFKVRARGRSTTGTSGNFAISLQFGNSGSASTNTVVCAPATQVNAANCVYFLEAIFVWDATKQQLENSFFAINGSTVNRTADAAGTTVTAVDLSTGAAGNAIVAAALFGTSNAGNIAYLDELSLEVL